LKGGPKTEGEDRVTLLISPLCSSKYTTNLVGGFYTREVESQQKIVSQAIDHPHIHPSCWAGGRIWGTLRPDSAQKRQRKGNTSAGGPERKEGRKGAGQVLHHNVAGIPSGDHNG